MAIVHLFPFPESKRALVVMLSSATLLLGNATIVGLLTKRIASMDGTAPVIAMLLTLFCYPLVYWSLRGLEVGLVTTLVVAFCLLTVTTVNAPPP